MTIELLIEHEGKLFAPVVEEGIEWSTERKGAPGQLSFTVFQDGILIISEGDAVRMKLDGSNVFYGFVFKKQSAKDSQVKVTAYDQLRYLKNKDTYVYENKTAGELIQMLAADFRLKAGALEDTGYKIPYRVEDNKTLFDIIQSALDLTLQSTKKMFVLFDDFGKLTLKNIENMKVNLLIDSESAQDFDYTSSIDQSSYNKIKLAYDNKDSGKREVYIAQSGENMNRWGVLQYFEKLQKGENGQAKADALLSLYNAKTKNLSIKDAFGDIRVRAGSMVPVMLNLGDVALKNFMLVEKCKHDFKQDQHLMTLTLRGGEFIA